jgi:hypothetical protein
MKQTIPALVTSLLLILLLYILGRLVLQYSNTNFQSSITRTDSVKDLGAVIDSELHFRNFVYFLKVSSCWVLFGL